MINRILKIIKEKNLTSARFADEIGVQRSSISHLLSGRNKPSLEFIQKILKTYPDIDTNWLLSGKGNILSERMKNEIDFPEESERIHKDEIPKYQKAKKEPESSNNAIISDFIDNKTIDNNSTKKRIEKIVVLYHDNSFKEYFPE